MSLPVPEPQDGVAPEVAAVDAALARLAEIDEAPLEVHADIYQEIHTTLQASLTELTS